MSQIDELIGMFPESSAILPVDDTPSPNPVRAVDPQPISRGVPVEGGDLSVPMQPETPPPGSEGFDTGTASGWVDPAAGRGFARGKTQIDELIDIFPESAGPGTPPVQDLKPAKRMPRPPSEPLPNSTLGQIPGAIGSEVVTGDAAATIKGAGASIIKAATELNTGLRRVYTLPARAAKAVLEEVAPDVAAKIPDAWTATGDQPIEEAFKGEMDALMEDAQRRNEAKYAQLAKEAGLPAATVYDIGNSMLDMGVKLAIQGYGQAGGAVKGIAGHLKNALDFAVRIAATTPGTVAERAKAGLSAAVFSAVGGIAGSKLGRTAGVAANLVTGELFMDGANAALDKAKRTAEANGKHWYLMDKVDQFQYWLAAAGPQLVQEIGFGLMSGKEPRENVPAVLPRGTAAGTAEDIAAAQAEAQGQPASREEVNRAAGESPSPLKPPPGAPDGQAPVVPPSAPDVAPGRAPVEPISGAPSTEPAQAAEAPTATPVEATKTAAISSKETPQNEPARVPSPTPSEEAPAPPTPEPAPAEAAQPPKVVAPFNKGAKVRVRGQVGSTEIIEFLPFNPETDIPGERYYKVKGREKPIEESGLEPVSSEKPATKAKRPTWAARLAEAGLTPEDVKGLTPGQKIQAIARAKAKRAEQPAATSSVEEQYRIAEQNHLTAQQEKIAASKRGDTAGVQEAIKKIAQTRELMTEAFEAKEAAKSAEKATPKPLPASAASSEAKAPEMSKAESRVQIRDAAFADLKTMAKNAKYGSGDTAWDRRKGDSATDLRAALSDHRKQYLESTGKQERKAISAETRAKLSKSAKDRTYKQQMVDEMKAAAARGDVEAKMALAELNGETEKAPLESLKQGDTFTIDGEPHRVQEETDTALRIKDGVEFFVPYEHDWMTIDKGSLKHAEQKPDLSLESVSPEQLRAEQEAKTAKAKEAEKPTVQELQAKPLKGKTADIDTTGDLFDQREAENPLFATPPPNPLAAEPRGESDKAGFMALPDKRDIVKIRVALKSLAGKLSSTHGLSEQVNAALKSVSAALDAIQVRSRRWKITVGRLEKDLRRGGLSRQDAATAVREVVHGQATADQLAQAYGIDPSHNGIESLKQFEATRAKAAADLGVYLRQTGHAELAKVVEDNPAYVTRAYRLFSKEGFTPEPAARQTAVDTIKTGFQERIAKIERIAQKLQTNRGQPTGLDVPRFLNSKGPTLDGVPPSMSNSRVKRLLAVRDAYRKLQDVIAPVEIDPATGKAKIQPHDSNLEDASQSIVDELLNRPDAARRPGQDYAVNHLKKRVLTDVFRELYGEIKEPVNEMMRTGEVQGKLLASQALMEHLSKMPEASSAVPQAEKGLTKQLPNDTKKYGNMAGRYVQPNLEFFLRGAGESGRFVRGYRAVLGAMRQAALFMHKAFGRNVATSFTGQALQTGELPHPRYIAEAAKAFSLLGKYAAGNVKAMKKVEQYARDGVFSLGGTASAQDLAAWSPGKFRQFLGKVYSSGDFAAQVASYEFQRSQGKTHAQAVEWLDRYYQRAHTTPIAARWLSRNTPFSDFMGYTAQSIRFTKNAAILAAKELKRGNAVPLAGFVLSHAVGLAMLTGQEELVRRWWTAHKKKHDPEAQDVPLASGSALGDFMPSYWKTTPKVTWLSKADGQPVMRTLIAGGQTAFPLDDTIAGIYSYLRQNPDMSNPEKLGLILDQSYGQMFDPNMLTAAGIKTISGKSTDPTQPDKPGLLDVYRVGLVKTLDDAAGRKMLGEMAMDLGGRFIPYGRTLSQLISAKGRENAGQTPLPGQKTSAEVIDNAKSFFRIETYDKDRALQAIHNRLRSIATTEQVKDLTDTKGAISRVGKAVDEQGAATASQWKMAEAGSKRRRQIIEQMRDATKKALLAFKPLGITTDDIYEHLDIQGLGKDEKAYILGEEPDLYPTAAEEENADIKADMKKGQTQ